jgi:hypothetical protein
MIALYAAGRVAAPVLYAGLVDLLLGILFLIAWWRLAGTSTREPL